MTGDAVTSRTETPVFFAAAGVDLFGIYTNPPRDALGVACVMLSGGGATAPATNRNRLGVHLARRLAGIGYHALRFDYHGVGESAGVLAGAPKVDEPFLEDVHAAVGWVRGRGIDRLVLIGSCFGARTALAYAPSVPGLEAVILVSPPLRDVEITEETATRLAQRLTLRQGLGRLFRVQTVRGLMHPARRHAYLRFAKVKLLGLFRKPPAADEWLSPQFLDPVRELADLGIPLVFVYGTEDWHYRDFLLAKEGRLGRVLAKAPLTEVIEVEGDVHALHLAAQQAVTAIVVEKLDALARRERSAVEEEVVEA